MYEVELKVPADLESVREQFEDIDASPIGSVTQIDTYFDAPHRSFADTDEALRIRREIDETSEASETTRVTYKGPLIDDASKTRKEIESTIDSSDAMETILKNLGFEPVATVRKEREWFELEAYTITLDEVADIGTFVEIETEVTEAEVESARDGAIWILERLGFDHDDHVRTSYLEMLLDQRS